MFNERVRRHAPWSISKANLLTQCGFQFDLKYIQKLKEESKSTQSKVGVVAHAVTEHVLKTGLVGDELSSFTRALVAREGMTVPEQAQVVAKVPSIEDYRMRVERFKASEGVSAEYIEQQLAIDEDFKSAPFFDNSKAMLRGVLDHGMRTQDDVLVIVDHKSGQKKPIKEHTIQFYAYMLLGMGNYPDLKGVQCAINYMGDSRLSWFPRHDGTSGPWAADEIHAICRPWLETFLNGLGPRLVGLDTGNLEPSPGWLCSYCGYVSKCAKGEQFIQLRANKASKPNV